MPSLRGGCSGFAASYPLDAAGLQHSDWLVTFRCHATYLLMLIFMALTMAVVLGGVEDGIERWSRRLMPLSNRDTHRPRAIRAHLWRARSRACRVYLLPDFGKVLSGDLLIDALGSAFFSLSLGVGTMLIYGSYLSDTENVPRVGAQVALLDVGIAVLAGFLILPAMYVADARGVAIFNEAGGLLSEDTLIFTVLPALFETIDTVGIWLATAFFDINEHRRPHLLYLHA